MTNHKIQNNELSINRFRRVLILGKNFGPQKLILIISLFAVILTASTKAQAEQFINEEHSLSLAQELSKNVTEYYTINENTLEQTPTSLTTTNYNEFLLPPMNTEDWLKPAKIFVVNLLNWSQHNEPLPLPQEKYQRKEHFGRWINDPNDDTCMNTRARVLVRDSHSNVTYKAPRQCVVQAGQWHDPYADQEITEARYIQIDHMVPLKNAYVMGAWEWDFQTRCLFANYENFLPHLVSANSHENMSKGDRGPDEYLPPNESFRCEYVRNWVAVKSIWKLKMTRAEVDAIKEVVTKYGCDLKSFFIDLSTLIQQRNFIQENLNFCNIHRR